MKRKTNILMVITAVVLMAGCEDFLEIRPEATIPTTGTDYTKSENIFLSVSASYASLRSYGAHVFPYIGAFEIASDNADKGSTPEDNPPMLEFDNLTYEADNGLINDLWIAYYDIVSGANYSIHQMPLFEEALLNSADKLYAMQCQGEVKTIRAYAYFNLTRLFGKVPIIDTVLTADQLASLSQASTAQLYDFIEQDLEEAIQVLLELTGRWPSLVMGNYWLGIACYHQGEYGASRKAFETLLQHSPESKIAHYHAALACFADKAYERARDHLLVMVNEGYRDPQVYQLLGRVYRRLQRYPEAVETYKKGLALNPDNGPLKLSLEDLTDVQDP